MNSSSGVAVVIASAGRPQLLSEVVHDLTKQTHKMFDVIVSVPGPASLPEVGLPDGTLVVRASGAAAQRNAGMRIRPNAAYYFFFDDDAVVREDYIANALEFFADHPAVVALTGRVLKDGSSSHVQEVSRDEATAIVTASWSEPRSGRHHVWKELYGCNFAFRADYAPDVFFDDRLPLYSWLEDLDLAGQLLRFGDIAWVEDCVIVHRGSKTGGRVAHQRLGYSQVMNPAYLCRKGTVTFRRAAREAVPRFGRNALGAVAAEESSWRRRRLLGNLRAIWDLARGRFTPERLTDIQPY